MKNGVVLLLEMIFLALLFSPLSARDAATPGKRPIREWPSEELKDATDPGMRGYYESAAADTYCLVWYTFEQMNWQGWTREDMTTQKGIFWHVDDFSGLGGGDHNRLHPIEGTKSMWCGCRPSTTDPYLCSWKRAPGYGNNWTQNLESHEFSFTGAITWSYTIAYDSELDYDYTRVQYDAGGGNWQTIAEYTGAGDSVATHFLALTQSHTKLRFHFTSDAMWSDEDGLCNTDGGAIVDAITVSHITSNYENFEGCDVGFTSCGIWSGNAEIPYGTYSGLKNNLIDKDPCGDNFATQVVFFIGSPYTSTAYPGLYDTPFCTGPGGFTPMCQNEIVISPIIDMTKYSTTRNNVQNGTIPAGDLPLLGGALLRFTVYRDLPLPNLVFYMWRVRQWKTGCPGQWLDDNLLYYGTEKAYFHVDENVSNSIGGIDPVQLAVGCIDMCDVWYLVRGNCAAHTPSPWIDNVRLYRFKTSGPQWGFRQLDLFQDNFPVLEGGIVRADAANDINANNNPIIRPGDSIVVDVSSLLNGGIAEDNGGAHIGGPSVYMHVKVTYVGPAPYEPPPYGYSLQGTYGWYDSDDGSTWTIIQGDTARTPSGLAVDKYMFDLNDALFTRGYMVEYYFTANDVAGAESALPSRARSGGPYFEFTCLPTQNTGMLFVDDYSGIASWNGAVEDYWMSVFRAVLPANDQPDKYDVNSPTSGVSNGLGSRVSAVLLRFKYSKIIWDCGDLESLTISDGTVNSDKSNDCQLLVDWMSQAQHPCGLWVCGDDVAYDLNNLASPQATTLMSTWCGVDFVEKSYFDLTGGRTGGGIVTPLITGDADAGIFVHGGVPDKFYSFGGCFIINQFDVLEKTTNGSYALSYPDFAGNHYHAGISATGINSTGCPIMNMWFGFSYMFVRDNLVGAPIDRFELAKNVLEWWKGTTNLDITHANLSKVNMLAQNFPNPFNPSTTIRFDMKEKGVVTLKVYNVAGQLVRTLVNGVRDAGSYSVTWNGKNNRGTSVASGIYFCKMESRSFSASKKMVMLR